MQSQSNYIDHVTEVKLYQVRQQHIARIEPQSQKWMTHTKTTVHE
jgi:hypothetical protein